MPQRGTTRRPKAEPVQEAAAVDAVAVEQYEYERVGINWQAVTTVFLFVAVLALLGVLAYDRIAGGSGRDSDRDRDDRRPVNSRLAEDIEDAMYGPDAKVDAMIFGLACQRYAERLEEEFSGGAGLFDQRQELINLTGIAAYFMTSAEGRNEYRDLPKVFADFNQGYFSEESGEATDEDRAKLVKYFRELEAAFKEVAK